MQIKSKAFVSSADKALALGAYSEDDIANLINTEVDEGNKAGHEPLRRACTIQKTLKVISYVFGIPMKTLFHLCGSESFCQMSA